MRQVTFTRRLRGRMTEVRPGVLDGELRTRGARLDLRLVFSDEATFEESGTVDFGNGDRLRFRSLGHGRLDSTKGSRARHGTAVLRVVDGAGRYAGASGRITSNFVLSPDGEVTDEQVVVLFIDREEK